uniref:Pectinesterase catalytic domain-containing protein n=1 Tax=Fagus sylvatica TaxID=28930 RepID=A0A2N9I892_FAGSY
MIWPTVPPGVQFIEEACSGLNYYTQLTCRTLLSTKESKAITSKGELFLALMKKTSTMAESYLNHLSMKVQSWFHQYFGKGNISEADLVVSQDGTGDVKTIMEAIERAPDNRKTPFIIQLKAGVYKEYVLIPSEKSNVRLVGEGRSSTIITGNSSPFENTAGPANHQAVAISVQAENVAFYRCKFSGYQDTIYYHSGWLEWDNRGIFGSTEYVEYGDSGVGAAVQGAPTLKEPFNLSLRKVSSFIPPLRLQPLLEQFLNFVEVYLTQKKVAL